MAVTKQKVRRSFFRIYTVIGVVLSILASLNSPATLPSAPDAGRTLKINCPFKRGLCYWRTNLSFNPPTMFLSGAFRRDYGIGAYLCLLIASHRLLHRNNIEWLSHFRIRCWLVKFLVGLKETPSFLTATK